MPNPPTSKPESAFICDCDDWVRSACAGEPFYKEHEGKRYCVLHFPGKEKSADFKAALQKKLANKDFDFRGVWFPDEVSFAEFDFTADADFSSATFSAWAIFSPATFSAEANFSRATFSGEVYFGDATFSARANFSHATFSAASFGSATFNAEADFGSATFSAEALFNSATFSKVANFSYATFTAAALFSCVTFSSVTSFDHATFSAKASFNFATSFSAPAFFSYATFSAEADFSSATFSAGSYFSKAAFHDHVKFSGDEKRQAFDPSSSLSLEFASIEKPDRVSFHTLTLHPHWFINIDPRKFDFINVHWSNSGKAKPELETLKSIELASAHRLLGIACRRLAANSEENDRYREASHFRRMALDAERLENWRGFDLRKLNWWYWAASGYGERPFQALMVLLGILLLFALLYTQVGFARWEPKLASEADVAVAKRDEIGAPLKFSRALSYSAGVMTLQKPEPRPATAGAQFFVFLETILGPVQAALLALAIRRKFMR
jgi:hypothetical protein